MKKSIQAKLALSKSKLWIEDVWAKRDQHLKNRRVQAGLAVLGFIILYQMVVSILSVDVVAAEARRGTAIKAVSGTITVMAEVETQLLSSGGGFIEESNLREAAEVKKGDVLVRLDPGELPFNIESTKIEIEGIEKNIARGSTSTIQLKDLERELIQSEDLLRRGMISQGEHDELLTKINVLRHNAETEMEAMRQNLQIRKNTLAQLEDRLRRQTVRAPMDGMVTNVYVYPGDLVSSGKVVADIISKKMKISAEVNQDDIEVIKPGGRANIRFFAYRNRLFKATVRQILPDSDPETQRFTVYLDMIEEPENMRPGITGEVSFFADERPNAILIPRRALLGSSILVIDGGRLERRKVSIGYLSYSDAEIISGLEEGERVVVEDVDMFRDGDRVSVERVIEHK